MKKPFALTGRVWSSHQDLNSIEDGIVVIDESTIAFVGKRVELPIEFQSLECIAVGLITPGLIDTHTHAAWVGSRHSEYIAKLEGKSYETIAQSGGGIIASMRAIEQASVDDIEKELSARLCRMASLGVTTVEIKSGYGLRADLERKQLEAIAHVAKRNDLPRVVPTYLALHALPPHARLGHEQRQLYVEQAAQHVKIFARENLAKFVDAYIDRNAFTVHEAKQVCQTAHDSGVGIRLHVGQFADVGGTALAREFNVASLDHLEHISEQSLEELSKTDSFAGLLPMASFVLNQSAPPIERFRQAGIRMLVASDANPGTAPTESLPLAMAFAARCYGLTTQEICLGTTRWAAHSLGLNNLGVLAKGSSADVVGWNVPHEDALIQPWGVSKTQIVLREGLVLYKEST